MTSETAQVATDPVCGMTVNPATAQGGASCRDGREIDHVPLACREMRRDKEMFGGDGQIVEPLN